MTRWTAFFGYRCRRDLEARHRREREAKRAWLAALLAEIADPVQRTTSAQ